jgi:hypothetical protein
MIQSAHKFSMWLQAALLIIAKKLMAESGSIFGHEPPRSSTLREFGSQLIVSMARGRMLQYS